MRKLSIFVGILLNASMAQAIEATDAQIVFLGEVHDNPAHHERQAKWVAALAPTAVVYEMLTAEQAGRVDPNLDEAALSTQLDWDASGWPDFAMYYPIFEAAGQAKSSDLL